MKLILSVVVAAVVVAGFLGFTTSGHHVLNTLGFATACDSNNC